MLFVASCVYACAVNVICVGNVRGGKLVATLCSSAASLVPLMLKEAVSAVSYVLTAGLYWVHVCRSNVFLHEVCCFMFILTYLYAHCASTSGYNCVTFVLLSI